METLRLVFVFLLIGSLLGLYQNWNKDMSQQKKETTHSEKVYDPLAVPQKNSKPLQRKEEMPLSLLTVSSPLTTIRFDTKTGDIVSLDLKKYHRPQYLNQPYPLMNWSHPFYRSHLFLKIQKPNEQNIFIPSYTQGLISHSPDGKQTIVSFETEKDNIHVKETYTIHPSSYIIDVRYLITNKSDLPINTYLFGTIQRDRTPTEENSRFIHTYLGPSLYTKSDKFRKIPFSDLEKQHTETAMTNGWCAFIQHYFVTAWIPNQEKMSAFYAFKDTSSKLYSVGFKQELTKIPAHSSSMEKAIFYAGPQEQNKLDSIAPGLNLVTDYGWLTLIAQPLFKLLSLIHQLAHNWGWAIILLTIFIKMIFFPLSATSYQSMARMKKLSPKIQTLKNTYTDKAEQQKALMALFQKEKINPAAGCLPILIQIPVFISLYYVLSTSVEIKQAAWLGWITDLSLPDPYYILPSILALSTFFQTKLNPPSSDPIQEKIMIIMPLIFSAMFFFFPSGLVLYWITNNLLSIAQQLYISQSIRKHE